MAKVVGKVLDGYSIEAGFAFIGFYPFPGCFDILCGFIVPAGVHSGWVLP
jgi:hypothetical protein